eukprot:TRINITY_DN1948_c0_g1_i1.p3 TRINITY_DN1948_c0_g1~~TRINITY_DN1948_c0_g1_i1.p3  ORF type:complete len:120 (-),score=20.12 TRINITY_DN1948_c0_g1_i1:215-574(-)
MLITSMTNGLAADTERVARAFAAGGGAIKKTAIAKRKAGPSKSAKLQAVPIFHLQRRKGNVVLWQSSPQRRLQLRAYWLWRRLLPLQRLEPPLLLPLTTLCHLQLSQPHAVCCMMCNLR